MNQRTTQTGLLCMSIALVLFSCSNPPSTDATEKENGPTEVRIGSIMPMTGALAAYGEYAHGGQVKAIQELNASQSKFRFSLVLEDGKSEGKESVTAYRKLRSDNVDIITAGSSVLAMPILPLAKQEPVLFFPSASHPGITETVSPLVFRNFVTAQQEVPLILQAISDAGGGDIGLVWVNDDFGKGFNTSFTEQVSRFGSVNLVLNESITKGETNFTVLIGKLMQQKPDGVVVVNYGASASTLINKLREHGLTSPVYCSFSFLLTNADKTTSDKTNLLCVDGVSGSVDPKEFCDYSTVKLIGSSVISTGSTAPRVLAEYIASQDSISVDGLQIKVGKDHEIEQQLRLTKLN